MDTEVSSLSHHKLTAENRARIFKVQAWTAETLTIPGTAHMDRVECYLTASGLLSQVIRYDEKHNKLFLQLAYQ